MSRTFTSLFQAMGIGGKKEQSQQAAAPIAPLAAPLVKKAVEGSLLTPKKQGRSQTIFTSNKGLGGYADTARKTLLGQ
jgi:hypothetical protein